MLNFNLIKANQSNSPIMLSSCSIISATLINVCLVLNAKYPPKFICCDPIVDIFLINFTALCLPCSSFFIINFEKI